MRKGEIWEADIGGKAGRRPVLIMTRSRVIPYLSKLVVAEITTQGKGYPTQIPVEAHGNLKRPSFVSAEALHTLPKERLRRLLGELPADLIQKVNDAVIFALELVE